MIWTIALIVIGSLVVASSIVAVITRAIRRSGVAPEGGGFAPGWRLRCAKCGWSADAGEAGIVRIGAASFRKRVLGTCGQCGRVRLLALERVAGPCGETAV